MDTTKKELKQEEMKHFSGGFAGEYGYIGTYNCPKCGTPNTINQYCYSGKTTWNCERGCGAFVINF